MSNDDRRRKLPKWAQRDMAELEQREQAALERVRRVEQTLPWTEDGMEWFTVGVHTTDTMNLFLLQHDRAQSVCSIGPNDRLFVGRGIASDEA